MDEYWNGRYRSEGRIWGSRPSSTAAYACQAFRAKGVKSVFIPGIGYGRNARPFSEAGMAVEGIEISPEAVSILVKDLPGVICRTGSALETPFYGPFDAIYCFNVLHLFKAEDRHSFVKKCSDAMVAGGLVFFTVFSEKEPSYGKGLETEPGTFESKPGRPVHYFTEDDLRAHFKDFHILETGLMEDEEDHGEEGAHVHVLRYVLAGK